MTLIQLDTLIKFSLYSIAYLLLTVSYHNYYSFIDSGPLIFISKNLFLVDGIVHTTQNYVKGFETYGIWYFYMSLHLQMEMAFRRLCKVSECEFYPLQCKKCIHSTNHTHFTVFD